MSFSVKFLSGSMCLSVAAMMLVTGLANRQAQAQICCAGDPSNDVSDFGLIYTGDPHNLDFSNSTVIGNVGIGDNGGFTGSGGGTITGTLSFAGLQQNVSFKPDDVSIGAVIYGSGTVTEALASLNTVSQNLRNEGGTPLLISAGGSINASTGILNSGGNYVFTATINPNFTAGNTFTINGTSDQFIVINTTTGGLPLDGSIVLTGGITPDHVLFNLDAADYDTLTGGDPLIIDTGGNATTGLFLDPNGAIDISDLMIFGRVFGGDTVDASISDSTIVAPPPFAAPEPSSLLLLGGGLVAACILRRRNRWLRPHS